MTLRLLTPVRSRENARVFYIYSEYYQMFKKQNIEIIMITPSTNQTYQLLCNMCDGLLLTGGIDIDPKYYHQPKDEKTNIELDYIEEMEFKLIELFNNQNKPIIGICRGIQTINVFFKGTLIQDIDTQINNTVPHSQDSLTGYCHDVTILPNTLLSNYLDKRIKVNSFHHQCIDLLAPEFIISATSDDGLIEAIEKDNIVAVQWHPEKVDDINQLQLVKLFKSLLES